MVWRKANGPQQYTRILKETTMEAAKLRILRAEEPIIKEVEAKLKISVKEDI